MALNKLSAIHSTEMFNRGGESFVETEDYLCDPVCVFIERMRCAGKKAAGYSNV